MFNAFDQKGTGKHRSIFFAYGYLAKAIENQPFIDVLDDLPPKKKSDFPWIPSGQ